jgi:EVE domain
MNVWLCPIKKRSWQLIRRYNVFGAPKHAGKLMEEVKIGDSLIIYVLRPTNAILAIYRVKSEVHNENRDIWGRYRYPLRVDLEILHDFLKEGYKPLPLSCIYGGNSRSNVSIEPFFKNVWLTKVGENQYESLLAFLDKYQKTDAPE